MNVPTNWHGIPLRTRKSRRWLILTYYAVLFAITAGLVWIGQAVRYTFAVNIYQMFVMIYSLQLSYFQREREDGGATEFSSRQLNVPWTTDEPSMSSASDRSPLLALNLNGRLRSFGSKVFHVDERDRAMEYIVYRRAYRIVALLFMLFLTALFLLPAHLVSEWLGRISLDTGLLLMLFSVQFLISIIQALRILVQPDDIGDGVLHLVSADEAPKEALP